MKIVLLGKNGQLGWELQRALAPLGELVALDRASVEIAGQVVCGDLNRLDSLRTSLLALRPDVIVNAAAYTAVDKAESDGDIARRINAQAPGVMAEVAASLGATLIHYSSDYVFDGSGDTPRAEDAATGPSSVYGATKLDGELAIRASGCRHLILRTSWVYAARGGNFARTMLRLAGEREALNVVDDQIGAPTGAELIADVSVHCLRSLQSRSELGGTYHLAAAGATSWYAYACHVIAWARAHGQAIKVAPEAIRPLLSSAYPTPARRPLNSRLDCSRLQENFGLYLPPWQTGVERMLDEVLRAASA
jgi:dTDP-4-dehydrorhamnose reductase